jgi:hypothetical protein
MFELDFYKPVRIKGTDFTGEIEQQELVSDVFLRPRIAYLVRFYDIHPGRSFWLPEEILEHIE